MKKNEKRAAFIGIGEVPTGRFPETAAIWHAMESAKLAIRDAGIDKDEIDYVMPTASLYSPAFNTELVTCRIVEELGLKNVKKNCQVFAGGSSSSCGLQLASSLIATGIAENVLFVHADRLGTGVTAQGGIDLFSTAGISSEWEVPYGQHYSAIAALSTTRYKFETGCTDEQLAAVCVSNRKWAQLNPNAFFNKKEITIDEILESKILSTPLHAKQSNMLFDGGGAFVLTSAERAADVCEKPVYVLGESGIVTHFVYSQEPDVTRFGWAKAGKKAFDQAELTPKDIDVAEIYDSYPVYQIIGLEELGFCERGEAGKLFLNGDTWPGGTLPCTTNGGMLSQGHTGAGGSVALLLEAVRQLMGKAGKRQVKDAKYAVETATGGTYMDAQVTVLGNKIP